MAEVTLQGCLTKCSGNPESPRGSAKSAVLSRSPSTDWFFFSRKTLSL